VRMMYVWETVNCHIRYGWYANIFWWSVIYAMTHRRI